VRQYKREMLIVSALLIIFGLSIPAWNSDRADALSEHAIARLGTPAHLFRESVRTASLSSNGVLLLNLEALLYQEFREHPFSSASRPGIPIDFTCGGICVPLSKYTPYVFAFGGLGRSSFRVTQKRLVGAPFGNGLPVLIRGRMIVCNAAGTEFLISSAAEVSLSLSCEKPL
jgi:hypothetical protein